MSSAAAWMVATSLASMGASAYGSYKSYDAQKDAQKDQKKALAEAEAKQDAANREAETQRLEGLKAEQTGTNLVDFGDDLQSRYLDANTKRQKKAQDMLDEDENPFYSQGLF